MIFRIVKRAWALLRFHQKLQRAQDGAPFKRVTVLEGAHRVEEVFHHPDEIGALSFADECMSGQMYVLEDAVATKDVAATACAEIPQHIQTVPHGDWADPSDGIVR